MSEFDKKAFREQHKIDLKGKEYLPVAARVVAFRQDHPTWPVVTEVRTIGEDLYALASVFTEDGTPIATAHKRVKTNARGPAAEWPVETAETGAIGRALALCGYGTLSGDLDEGDQIADAPVEKPTKREFRR